jgi:hypothetical protein
MPVPEENMTVLMHWLSDPEITSASYEAQGVNEDLAALVFQGDLEWANYEDRARTYAQLISPWLTSETEGDFTALTVEGGDPAAFFAWVVPVLAGWHESAAQDEAGLAGLGLANPNYESDPTPGTQFYRYDEQAGTYLYGETADGTDWAPYEGRRYSEATWDDGYGLSYRYDKRDEIYEWYDEEAGTWNSQEWADTYVAGGSASEGEAEAQAPSAGAWDENWQMFYRIGALGAYEYADSIVPGDESSGPGEVWLSYEQVMARAEQPDVLDEQTPGQDESALEQVPRQVVQGEPLQQDAVTIAADKLQSELLQALEEAFQADPSLAELEDDDIKRLLEEVVREIV